MSKFFDHIVAAGRAELGAARRAGDAGSLRIVAPGAPRDGVELSVPDPLDGAGSARARQAAAAPALAATAPGAALSRDAMRSSLPAVLAEHAAGAPATSTVERPAMTAAAPLPAPVTQLVESAPEPAAAQAAVGATNRPAALRSPTERRAAHQASALAGAWFEASAPVRPAAGPLRAASAGRAPSIEIVAPGSRLPHTELTGAGALPPVAIAGAVGAGAMRERTELPRSPAVAPRPVTGSPAGSAPRAPQPPSNELHIGQLDVRIVSEPAPRAAAKPAAMVRAASQLGAWRPFARRFVGRP